jgi:hypothetical protein
VSAEVGIEQAAHEMIQGLEGCNLQEVGGNWCKYEAWGMVLTAQKKELEAKRMEWRAKKRLNRHQKVLNGSM